MFATTASEGRAGRVSERRTINTGRNLPVAFAVGAGLGALVIVTLLTMKITFLILVAVIVGMAPAISPKKTWEGLAGSIVFCLAAGALGMTYLLPGTVWSGLVLGGAAVAAATLGDLVESMMKRDLDTKDMGSILPGHGGVLDRIDALLIVAPVAWLVMTIFLS